jgi:sugar phosphate isomerase/epimerase
MNNNLPFVSNFAIHNYMKAEEGIIDAAKSNFQVWYIDLGFSDENPRRWNNNRIDQLILLTENYKVKPILHSNFSAPLASSHENSRLEGVIMVKEEINLAHRLNAPLIIHGGAIHSSSMTKEIKASAIETYLYSLIELKAYADNLNVNLYLENLCNDINDNTVHYVFSEVDEFQYILDRIDLPLYLDIGHANLCGENPINIIEKFHHKIIGMCFSNNNGIIDQHLDIEEGIIDYKELIKYVLKVNWRGLIAFETRNKISQQNIIKINKLYRSVV